MSRSSCRRTRPIGFITAIFASFTGFALIWHIWWLAIAGVAGALGVLIVLGWRREDEHVIPAAEVARLDRERRQARDHALLLLDAARAADARSAVLPHEADPHRLGHRNVADAPLSASEAGPADKRVVAAFGFWIFLLSDIVLFSALFATYAVLGRETAGGPGAGQLFDSTHVAIETVCLLLSSFTCGLATLAARRRDAGLAQFFLGLTALLGAAFLAVELREFAGLLGKGAGPDRSAFLSSFFALVGCHGLHVTAGLLWLGTMMARIRSRGFEPATQRRLMCFSLFWHALDIVWVAVFTIVYLFGTLP